MSYTEDLARIKRKKEEREEKELESEEKKLALNVKSYTDIQRWKLEKMMKDPLKPVHIPQRPQEKNVNRAPEFNHNIMGSSAGAGSGEFHLYRQMRRKEQNRLKILGARQDRDDLNDAFHQKLEENQKQADQKTEKKRKKRQRNKKNKKGAKKDGANKNESSDDNSDEEEEHNSEPAPEVKGATLGAKGSTPEVKGSTPEVNSTPEVKGSTPEVKGSASEAKGSVPEAKGSVPEALVQKTDAPPAKEKKDLVLVFYN